MENGSIVSSRQIVIYKHLVAQFSEHLDDMAAYVSGTSGD